MITCRRKVKALAAALVISPAIVAYGASEPFESRSFEADRNAPPMAAPIGESFR